MSTEAFLLWFATWLESKPAKELVQAVVAIIRKYEV